MQFEPNGSKTYQLPQPQLDLLVATHVLVRSINGAFDNTSDVSGVENFNGRTGPVVLVAADVLALGFSFGGGAQNTVTLSGSIALPALAGAVSSVVLGSGITSGFMCLQVASMASGTALNYILELFDGAPANNLLVYQATGITVNAYSDHAVFFQASLTTGVLTARLTNVDANAVSAVVSVLYLGVL